LFVFIKAFQILSLILIFKIHFYSFPSPIFPFYVSQDLHTFTLQSSFSLEKKLRRKFLISFQNHRQISKPFASTSVLCEEQRCNLIWISIHLYQLCFSKAVSASSQVRFSQSTRLNEFVPSFPLRHVVMKLKCLAQISHRWPDSQEIQDVQDALFLCLIFIFPVLLNEMWLVSNYAL